MPIPNLDKGALFDPCGRKICEHTSHHQRLDVVAIPMAYLSHIFLSIHNHIHDITFSSLDLNTATSTNLNIMIVASPSRNYILVRPTTGWPESDWSEEYHEITQMLLRHRFYNYDLATARHLALMKVAKHYHIPYYVTDLDHRILTSSAS